MFPIFRVQIRNGLFIQHPFVVLKKKPFNKVHTGGIHLDILKTMYDKPTVNLILKDEKLRAFL